MAANITTCSVDIDKISENLKISGLIVLGFVNIIAFVLGFCVKICHSKICKKARDKMSGNSCSDAEKDEPLSTGI